MTEAFVWWNKIADDEDNSEEIPQKIPPEQMTLIWEQISPIFHAHVNYYGNEDEYWVSAQNCLIQLTDDKTIPNPNVNFSGFILKLFQYKDIIRINDMYTAIAYAQRFCPPDSNSFFISEFLYSVSDPFLAVRTIYEMNERNVEPWTTYISHYGAIERFFDLFITFLQPANRNEENAYENFRLTLANLMTTLICENFNKDITRKQKIAYSLYSRLLNLIIYSKTDASVSFARFAIAINKVALAEQNSEDRAVRLIALLNAAPSNKLPHVLVCEYVLSQAGTLIPYTLLAQQIAKHITSIYDLSLLERLAEKSRDARFVVVRTLAQGMVHSKCFMRAAAKMLASILRKYANEDSDIDIRDWINKFFTFVFVFFEMCAKREKYIRRIVSLAECISSDIFMNIDYVKDIILQNANSCYLMGHCEFIRDYFPIGDSNATSKFFKPAYVKCEKIKPKLKTFPFKNNSNYLIDTTKRKNSSSVSFKGIIDKQQSIDILKEFGLSDEEIKYVYKNPEASTIDQQNCIFTLEDFIDQTKEKVEKVRKKQKRPKTAKIVNINLFKTEGYLQIHGLRACLMDNEKKILDYQMQVLTNYVNIARDLISLMRAHSNIMVDTVLLSRDLNKGSADDLEYKQLKDTRVYLRRLAPVFSRKWVAPKFSDELVSLIQSQVIKFDIMIQYSPPGKVDTALLEYLKRSTYASMIEATSTVLEDGTVDAGVSTIWELNCALLDSLSLPVDQNAMILFQSLIRVMFDYAYALNTRPWLNRYKKASLEFLDKAREFSRRPVSFLSIPPTVISEKRQDQPIHTLWRMRHLTFEPLQYMTSPIEILNHIHFIVTELPTVSQTGKLTPPELQMLLLGLVVSTPPINIIAISKFIEKWGSLLSCPAVQKSKQLFLNCVIEISNLNDVVDDE